MKEALRYGFILGVICLVASGLLAGVNSLTKAKIVLQAKTQEEEALRELLSAAERFEAVESGEEILYYKAYDNVTNLIGFAFKVSTKGYSSVIEVMAGMKKNGMITAVKVLSQNETPGLGSRISEENFTGQFANKDVAGLKDIQAIAGATISSRAVIESVQKKAAQIQELVKNER